MIVQLANHLWQCSLFAIAAALLSLAFRANRAGVRYALWLAASLKFLVPFSLLMALGAEFDWKPAAQQTAAGAPSRDALLTIEQIGQPFAAPTAPRMPHTDLLPYTLGAAWLSGFLALTCLRYRAWKGIRATARRSRPLAMPLPVEARLSSTLLEPGVVGILHPILLLPEGVVERLAPSEFEAVIAHELCHVRRRDNLWAAMHMLVEALFWFYPPVWWIGARLVDERERACDEDVLRLGNRPEVYAGAILNVCKLYAESPLPLVSSVTGADIGRRIEQILSGRAAHALTFWKKAALWAAAAASLALPILIGALNTPAARA